MIRPLGSPPTPRARSTASEPVETVSTFIFALLPSRMIEPSPNCLVIADKARSRFFVAVVAGGFLAFSGAAAAALDMEILVNSNRESFENRSKNSEIVNERSLLQLQ